MKITAKINTSLAFLFVSVLTVNAQTIKWGELQKNTAGSRAYCMLGNDEKGVYMLKASEPGEGSAGSSSLTSNILNNMTLEKYDYPDMKREFSKEMYMTEDGTKKGPKMYYDDMFYMKDNMLLTMFSHDVNTLYAMKVNRDGSLDNNKTTIRVFDKWKKRTFDQTRLRSFLSKDKTSIVAYAITGDKADQLTLKAIDETGKELWTKESQDPFKARKLNGILKAHSLTGNIMYLLASFGTSDKPEGCGLLIYDHKTDKLTVTDIKLEGTNVPNLVDFDLDNSGNAVLAGFYGDEKSKETAIGIFNARITKDGQITVSTTTLFDKDFLAHVISDGKVKRGKGIDQLGMKEIVLRDDGSVVIAAEQSNTYNGYIMAGRQGWQPYSVYNSNMAFNNSINGGGITPNGSGAGMSHGFGAGVAMPIEEYDYYDVIVAKINTDGSVGWVKSVAKKQGCQFPLDAPSASSYSLYVSAKNVYVVYNDGKKNAENTSKDVLDGDNSDLKMTAQSISMGHPVTMCESIDIASGDAKRMIILQEDEIKYRFFCNMFLQMAPDKVIVYNGDRTKNDQLGVITLE